MIPAASSSTLRRMELNTDMETERMAAEAVDIAKSMEKPLDYSEGSIPVVEDILRTISEYIADLSEEAQHLTAQRFGCYLLTVGLRTYGGRTLWSEERGQPVLVVGEPECRIAVMTWDNVLARVRGDSASAIPFFWAGFAERAKRREPGSDVLVS